MKKFTLKSQSPAASSQVGGDQHTSEQSIQIAPVASDQNTETTSSHKTAATPSTKLTEPPGSREPETSHWLSKWIVL